MLVFVVWLQLVIFSIVLGSVRSVGQRIRIVIYQLSPDGVTYTFGVVHRSYDAVSADGNTRWVVERMTIGFILVAIEWEFYKLQDQDPDHDPYLPPPGAGKVTAG